ncbi:MAG TPA: hypothetical protein ENI93_01270 [Gammaproteobacteria bacterium]|nr:hypothetical protein [Gammaproteobacteria bacterium]
MNISIRGILSPVVMVTVLLGLVACGGGDSGSDTTGALTYTGPTAIVDLTTTDAGSVAGDVWSNIDALSFNPSGVVDGTPTAVQTRPAGGTSLPGLNEQVRRAVNLLPRFNATEALPAGVTTSQTLACSVSGSITMTANQQDSNKLSPGDRYELRFNNCDQGTDVTSGSLSMNIDSFSGDPALMTDYAMAGRVSFDVTVRDKSTGASFRGAGGMNFEQSQTGTVMSSRVYGTRVVFSEGARQLMLRDFDFWEDFDSAGPSRTYSADFTLSSTDIGGTVIVQTLVPFQSTGYFANPTVGSLRITGANDAWVQLDAESDGQNVTLSWDLNPIDGTADASKTVLWEGLPTTTIP